MLLIRKYELITSIALWGVCAQTDVDTHTYLYVNTLSAQKMLGDLASKLNVTRGQNTNKYDYCKIRFSYMTKAICIFLSFWKVAAAKILRF